MTWQVRIKASAVRELRSLPKEMRLDAAIRSLGREPHPRGAVKLVGRDATYRIRVGDYRVIYEIRGNGPRGARDPGGTPRGDLQGYPIAIHYPAPAIE